MEEAPRASLAVSSGSVASSVAGSVAGSSSSSSHPTLPSLLVTLPRPLQTSDLNTGLQAQLQLPFWEEPPVLPGSAEACASCPDPQLTRGGHLALPGLSCDLPVPASSPLEGLGW